MLTSCERPQGEGGQAQVDACGQVPIFLWTS